MIAKILISPFSQKLRSGAQNSKNYPYWQELITQLKCLPEIVEIIQIGVGNEYRFEGVTHKFNLPISEVEKLAKNVDLWLSVDNFFPHLCNANNIQAKGIVLFSRSNPEHFGYPQNINILKDKKYLRPDQFHIWDQCQYDENAYVSPEFIINKIKSLTIDPIIEEKPKTSFYVDKTEDKINLHQEWTNVNYDWSKRFDLKYDECMSYFEIYYRNDYFRGDCTIIPNDVVVDIGANVGIFMSRARDMGAGRIIGYEPSKNNFVKAKKNNPNNELFNLAVSNKKDQEIEIYLTESSGGHTTIKSFYDKNPYHYKSIDKVKTTTLNDIFKDNDLTKIDFLKIDTEGSELLIFGGLSDENLDKISNIALEYHSVIFDHNEAVLQQFMHRLITHGFNTSILNISEDCKMIYCTRGKL